VRGWKGGDRFPLSPRYLGEWIGLFLFDGVGTCDIYIQEIHTHGDERLLVTGVDLDDFMV